MTTFLLQTRRPPWSRDKQVSRTGPSTGLVWSESRTLDETGENSSLPKKTDRTLGDPSPVMSGKEVGRPSEGTGRTWGSRSSGRKGGPTRLPPFPSVLEPGSSRPYATPNSCPQIPRLGGLGVPSPPTTGKRVKTGGKGGAGHEI